MSAAENKAVFLSYASQDAEAVQRIADALRAAGVEVWFDQNELVGGDAWDAKIRKQIAECTLFVPIISANTNARGEGYFRLKWKLAVDRSHLMAEGVPFLVPVVIDDTPEAGALVPELFLHVQWTRIPSAQPTAQFIEQVKRLLAAPRGRARPVPAAPVERRPAECKPATATRRASPLVWAGLGVGALAVAGLIVTKKPAPPAPPTVAPSAAKTAAPATVSLKSIAVLPFTNLSDDKDANAFFADGIHEDILTHLANIAELKVISRTSVMQYRDTKLPLRKIAQDLGVAYVLEGSVRRAGGQVRVTAQLIRAATDEHVWARNYDRELKDIFAIQTTLATEIAAALHSVLSPHEKKLIARVPTASLDAYDLFLKVREVRNRTGSSVPSLQEQERMLERAVGLDPQFGLAWAKLAWARSFLAARVLEGNDKLVVAAREAVEKARGIIPDAPEFLLGRGWFYYFVEEEYGRAFAEFSRAAELSPSFAEARYAMAMVHRRQGHWRETLQTLQEVERIDPANPEYAQEIAVTALSGRRYAEVETAARRAIALGRKGEIAIYPIILPFMSRGELPTEEGVDQLPATLRQEIDLLRAKPGAFINSAGSVVDVFRLAAAGEKEAVRARLEPLVKDLRQRLESNEPTNARGWAQLGLMEALSGHRDEARRCAGRALALGPELKDAWFGQGYRINVAHAYAWAGDIESALREYERLLQTPVPWTREAGGLLLNVHAMRRHPAFAPLRDDPRFQALLNDPKNNAPLF